MRFFTLEVGIILRFFKEDVSLFKRFKVVVVGGEGGGGREKKSRRVVGDSVERKLEFRIAESHA